MMRKRMVGKKIAAMLLAAVMMTSALGGCGKASKDAVSTGSDTISGKTTEGAAETADGVIPITFSRAQDSTMETNIFAKMEGATYDDNIWTQLIEERLGYDIQYLWIASSAELQTQKFNAAMASGTIPDIVSVNKTDLKQLVDADLVVDMAPYFEEYASDFLKELVGAAGDACISAATFDGVQYGIPIVDCDLELAQLLWLRQDWLDELGLKAPETLEELKVILRAFKEHAGEGGIGLSMSKNIYGGEMNAIGWMNANGAFPQAWIDDGAGGLVYGSVLPEMKESLGQIAELYAEGLLDPEFYVNDGEKSKEALVNGKCGAMYGRHASALWPLQDSINADPEADWVPYAIPMKEQGAKKTLGISMLTSNWYAVSKDCKNPEALIELLNLYCEKVLDPELNEYAVYANPGNGLEGVWRLTPVTINSPNKNQVTAKAIEEPLKTGDASMLSGEQYSMWDYSYQALNGDRTLWGWNRVFGEGGSQQMLISYEGDSNVELVYDQFFGAPGEVMASRKTTLDDMLDQTFIKIIAGQESPDAFDTVVEEWKKAGGVELTAEINEWYQNNK